MKTYEAFLPVDPDFYDIVEVFENKHIKVFYFGVDSTVQESEGPYLGIQKDATGEYLTIKNDKRVRLDRVITINGKVGPAFDEYDGYANACLSCLLGYEHNEGK